MVKLFSCKAKRRRILHKHHLSMTLNYRFAVNLVLLVILLSASFCIQLFIISDLFKGRTFRRTDRRVYRFCQVAGSPYIMDLTYILPMRQSVRKLCNLMLAHSEHKDIRHTFNKN